MHDKTRPIAIALTLGLSAAAVALTLAQSPAPAQPQGPGAERARKFPVKLHPHDLESSFIRMPLPPGQEKYGRLTGARLKGFVNEITAVSRQSRDDGDLLWGRIAGTKYDDMVETIVENKFKEFGLSDVRRQYFTLPPQWFPTAWQFRAAGSGKTLTFKTIQAGRGSKATPPGGLDLDAVWVGLGSEADFAGRDVKGKLAVLHSFPMPSVVGHSAGYNGAMRRAVEKGAAAILINVAIPGNLLTAVSAPEGLTTFSFGTEDAAAFQQLLVQGPVKVHLELATEMRSGLRDANVWGSLPGTSDEDMIIMAHHDAFYEGALDNASGMAVMLGLAEYYSKIPREQRRRTLKFVTTSGHHVGSDGTRWMHDNKDTFLAKTALLINCEHVSAIQMHWDRFGANLRRSDNIAARRWWVNGSGALARVVLSAYKMFGVTIYDDMDATTTGDMSHIDRDAPSVQLIESALFYHTDRDRPDYVPEPGLEAVARAYAKIIDDVNTMDRAALMPESMPTTSSGQPQGR
jgi:hypothetical protein